MTVDRFAPEVSRDQIVGGAAFAGLPAVGAILNDGEPWCTGTIIAKRKVATAAHCLHGVSASHLRFALGEDSAKPTHVLRVASAKAHPDYDDDELTNDIGLITLAEDAPVEPIGVIDAMDASWVGAQLFFIGYGVTNGFTQTGAGKKRAVWMKVSRVNETSFRYNDIGKNTCNGDSGGPALFKNPHGTYSLVGVTSFGDTGCASYGVDTRVDTYRPFLGLSGGAGGGSGGSAGCPDGLEFVGRCDGTNVQWCENGQSYSQNCAERGLSCGFDAQKQFHGCVSGDSADEDPCNGETLGGRCEDGSVIWCENQQVKSLDCNAAGRSCGYDSSKKYYNCL